MNLVRGPLEGRRGPREVWMFCSGFPLPRFRSGLEMKKELIQEDFLDEIGVRTISPHADAG
jgi:hypothetical protein